MRSLAPNPLGGAYVTYLEKKKDWKVKRKKKKSSNKKKNAENYAQLTKLATYQVQANEQAHSKKISSPWQMQKS